MFSQLEEEIYYIGREGFWTVPVKDGDSGASVNNGIPKMNFGRREVEDRGDAEGYETKGLEMRK